MSIASSPDPSFLLLSHRFLLRTLFGQTARAGKEAAREEEKELEGVESEEEMELDPTGGLSKFAISLKCQND